jgi:hypothetical protein
MQGSLVNEENRTNQGKSLKLAAGTLLFKQVNQFKTP